jgi:hypothetical protein
MKHHDRKRLEREAALARQTNMFVQDNRTHNDVPAMDAATKVLLDHVGAVQGNVRAQLDILRQTRGQRIVGEVRVPPHLQVVQMIDDSGVESRGDVTTVVRGER